MYRIGAHPPTTVLGDKIGEMRDRRDREITLSMFLDAEETANEGLITRADVYPRRAREQDR
jgi:hypothetical protein